MAGRASLSSGETTGGRPPTHAWDSTHARAHWPSASPSGRTPWPPRANVPPVVTRCSVEGYAPVVEKSPVLGGLGTERSPSQLKRRGLMKRSLRRSTIGMVAVLFMSAAMAKADVVLDWNAIMTSTVVAQNPFAQ